MAKKTNPMKYFSGSTLARLPLYKLLAGGTAVLLCASLGIGAMAAGFTAPEPTTPPAATATPAPTPQATPSPTPEPTAEPETPDPAISLEVTVVQQEIGVQLYLLVYPETPVFDNPEDEAAYVPEASEKKPLTGVALSIALADAEGTVTEYPLDTTTGTALAEELEPGDYTVTVPAPAGHTAPAPQTVTVSEKVEYKADVEAVQEKIVQATEVVESQEDSSYGGGAAPIANEVSDTVTYAQSSTAEAGSTIVYTAQLSADGHLLMTDGTVTDYLPVYDEITHLLTGAIRDTSANNSSGIQMKAFPANAGIVPLGRATPAQAALRQVADDGIQINGGGGDVAPVAPVAPATSDPAVTPIPDIAIQQPAGTQPPVATAPPDAPLPTALPNAGQAAPSATSGLPDAIEASALAGYGFAVTSQETAAFEYTGWQTIDGVTYYYDPASHQRVTGTQVIDGNVYTFGADGALNQTARGVDVSKFQGSIDWNAVAADGISFAIIRCGYRGYGSGALVEDAAFRANIQGAINAGLQVGVYFYSQAITEAEAVEEASMVLSLCGGYNLPYGVYYDTEQVGTDVGRADSISAAQRTACAVAFCETIRSAGYTAGVYSYASWFYNALNFANISKYRIWVAQYRDVLDFGYSYNLWQYTSTGKVSGIGKPVDINLG